MRYIYLAFALFSLLSATFEACAQNADQSRQNVAILIFDGVQIIDYTGPYEVLGSRGRRNVFTVSETGKPITTAMGMNVTPTYSFDNAPKIDILILPGGGNIETGANGRGVGAQLSNARVMKWVKDTTAQASNVMSVCNGAFFLAANGLLQNMPATTTAGFIRNLTQFSPTTRPVYDKRFVDNGKFVTTAGLSSGIDGALHLIEKLDGKGWAQQTALNIEYNWQPDSAYARANIADMKLPNSLGNLFDPKATPVNLQGDHSRWEEEWNVAGESTSSVIAAAESYWSKEPGWTKLGASDAVTRWQLKDASGEVWVGSLIAAPAEEKGRVRIKFTVSAGSSAAATLR